MMAAAAAVLVSCCCCYYSATFPSLLYPVPMEDDSCKRVEASDKAEITVLESCIGLYTGLFHFILFYFIQRRGGRRLRGAKKKCVVKGVAVK